MANVRLICVSLLVAFGGNFQYGYHISIVNPAREVFKDYLNESHRISEDHLEVKSEFHYAGLWNLVVNIFQAGLIIGPLPVSFVSEKIGRRWLMIATNLVAIVGTTLVCIWPIANMNELLIAGRFLLGLHAGAFDVVQSLYITEISPTAYRGIVASFQEICIVGTVAMGVIVGLPDVLGISTRFFHLLWLGAVPSVLQTFLLFFCPESPKHLLLTSKDEPSADISIKFFHGDKVDLAKVKKLIREEAAEGELQLGCGDILSFCQWPTEVRRGILVGVVAAVSQVLTGIFALDNFSTLMFRQAGLRERNAQLCTVGITSFHLVLSICALTIVERFPRRRLLLGSIAGCAVCNCLYVVLSQVAVAYSNLRFIRYLAISAYLLHMGTFALGAGPIPWFLASEMVPQRYRAVAQSTAMLMMNVAMLATGFAFLPLTNLTQSYAILILFVGPSALSFFFLFRFMPETRGLEIGQLRWDRSQSDPSPTANIPTQPDGRQLQQQIGLLKWDRSNLSPMALTYVPIQTDGRQQQLNEPIEISSISISNDSVD